MTLRPDKKVFRKRQQFVCDTLLATKTAILLLIRHENSYSSSSY